MNVRRERARPMAALALVLVACGDVEERRAAEPAVAGDTARIEFSSQPAVDSVDVVFTRAEAPVVLRRPAARADEPLRSALEALLAGPTPQERAEGIESWFSEKTSRSLRSVAVDTDGHAVVDFEDLRAIIPNAGSSTGSALLLTELNGTVFRFPEIRSAEYRIVGSCDAFWDWLQYGCRTVTREGT
ncbi:MAG TPA: GerMN domain-containing protein [Longimicrobiales bacterium]|nr:GerMN domain-containing protein [Longimicrobiales bacterium]